MAAGWTSGSLPCRPTSSARRCGLGYRTQNDLAQAIGVSRSAVSLWLEGKVGVPRPVAMLLRMLVSAQRRVLTLPWTSAAAVRRADRPVMVEILRVEAGQCLRLELLEGDGRVVSTRRR